MIINTISGQDIDHALTQAMKATLDALVAEGLIENDTALEFKDSHICLPVDDSSIWNRIRIWVGLTSPGSSIPVVFKVSVKRNS